MTSPDDGLEAWTTPGLADCAQKSSGETPSRALVVPKIFWLQQVSEMFMAGVSESYLRAKLRSRVFSGVKIAGRWAMTESQIAAAIQTLTSEARPVDPPSAAGLSKHSKLRRQFRTRGAAPSVSGRGQSTQRAGPGG